MNTDVSVNKSFKGSFIKLYTQCAMVTIHAQCLANWRPPDSLVLKWIVIAWKAVKYEIVIKFFGKCNILNKLGGIEDCVLWDNSTSEESEEETILSYSEIGEEYKCRPKCYVKN